MNKEQEEKRFKELLDAYLDVPVDEKIDRMVHMLNRIVGFSPGKGWVAPHGTPSPFDNPVPTKE